jgi:hypothetical protein
VGSSVLGGYAGGLRNCHLLGEKRPVTALGGSWGLTPRAYYLPLHCLAAISHLRAVEPALTDGGRFRMVRM